MSELTRITPAQEAILDTYTCQRLTADPDNFRKIQNFRSKQGGGLVHTLQNFAWDEDTDGVPNVYYVVKDAAGEIALFFSLKCGVLCDPEYAARVFEKYDRSKELKDALLGKESTQWAQEQLEALRTSSGEIPFAARMQIKRKYWDAYDAKCELKDEKNAEHNSKLIRVDEAFPAVELVHFCVNDELRPQWKAHGLKRGMGEVFFWRFVLPKIRQIHELVGCEYVYLFAADVSADATLINYYERALHFRIPTKLGTIKPRYDFLCPFMCRRLFGISEFRKKYLDPDLCSDWDAKGLADYGDYFFEHFNEKPAMVR